MNQSLGRTTNVAADNIRGARNGWKRVFGWRKIRSLAETRATRCASPKTARLNREKNARRAFAFRQLIRNNRPVGESGSCQSRQTSEVKLRRPRGIWKKMPSQQRQSVFRESLNRAVGLCSQKERKKENLKSKVTHINLLYP